MFPRRLAEREDLVRSPIPDKGVGKFEDAVIEVPAQPLVRRRDEEGGFPALPGSQKGMGARGRGEGWARSGSSPERAESAFFSSFR